MGYSWHSVSGKITAGTPTLSQIIEKAQQVANDIGEGSAVSHISSSGSASGQIKSTELIRAYSKVNFLDELGKCRTYYSSHWTSDNGSNMGDVQSSHLGAQQSGDNSSYVHTTVSSENGPN